MILLLIVLFILSYFLTRIVRYYSLKKNIIDIPNSRSSHSVPTPRGGGLAILISWYFGLTCIYLLGIIETKLYLALISGAILAVISFLDDIFDVKPTIRLIVQASSVILSTCLLGGLDNISVNGVTIIPSFIITPVAIIGFVWFINLYNFLDGIDGYASIEAICISIIFYFLTGDIINAVIIVSVGGFLVWNWPKAKIFMGDVGSTQLGFILFVLGIYYHDEGQISILWWIILTAPFWFDATYTLFRRWKNKEKLSQAHRKHIYQRLVQSGFSHLKVDILLIILNSLLCISVFVFKNNETIQVILLIIIPVSMYLIAAYTEKRSPFLNEMPQKK